ncbi:uncharacterized protein LOC142175266 [Nicotiana tabacum]|uniref:Uncharacterized protein LOC142175266 n=1 Tax=Nicotiana tabacum TaxID=4097 RepID=A0AC58TL42_TOBAC
MEHKSVKTQQAFHRVINMQKEHGFFIVALMETFQKKRLLQKYRRRLGMENAISNVNGKIWLFLDTSVEWDLLVDTEQQLTIKVYYQDICNHIMMTFVYAKCSSLERLELWDNLYYLASDMDLPWVVGGNFNVILNEEEKRGGLPVHPPEYEDFAFFVNSFGLFDLGYTGSPITWWNERANAECIFNWVDMIFVNQPFQTLFPSIEVEHLIRTGSDHAPLLMNYGKNAAQFLKPFRFLNFWELYETFKDVVRQNWFADFM